MSIDKAFNLSDWDKSLVVACMKVSNDVGKFVEKEIANGRMTIEDAAIYQRNEIQKQVPHFQMPLEQVYRHLSPLQEKQLRSLISQL